MAEQLANNAASTLNGGIDNAVTSLAVANGTVFPSSGNFRIIIDNELILVGARSGNTLSSLTRALESTSAASHSNGATVTHVLTKGGLDQYLLEKGYQTVASFGIALPGSPADGDEFILVDSTSAPTWSWHLRYVAAKASNKWIFIGGVPLYAEVTTSETHSTVGSYAALTTPGPSITIPVAGDYFVTPGASLATTGAGGTIIYMSYDIGGTGAVDADAITATQGSGSSAQPSSARVRRKSLTAVTLTAKYKTSATNVTAYNRWLQVTPIAIGG